MEQAWTAERLRKEQPYIKCDNLKERAKVIEKLESIGMCRKYSIIDNEIIIVIYPNSEEYPNGYYVTIQIEIFEWHLKAHPNITIITASEFLNSTPPNPELIALKKRLLEIADSGVEEYESRYFNEIIDFIYDSSGTTCTALANLIINADL